MIGKTTSLLLSKLAIVAPSLPFPWTHEHDLTFGVVDLESQDKLKTNEESFNRGYTFGIGLKHEKHIINELKTGNASRN